MAAKNPRKTLVRLPRASKQTADKPPASHAGRQHTYQVGDLWDERETEFFGPYLELVRHREPAKDHPPR